MANPWDPLPKEAMGTRNSATLYAAVGRALSTWESLEVNLGMMFGLMSGSLTEIPVRAYGVLASSKGRLDVLEEAIACYPGRSTKKLIRIKALLKNVGRFGVRRNEIAHGIVTQVTIDDIDQGYFLCPARYASRKHHSFAALMAEIQSGSGPLSADYMLGKYAYRADQVNYYRREFRKLTLEAAKFNRVLGGRLA